MPASRHGSCAATRCSMIRARATVRPATSTCRDRAAGLRLSPTTPMPRWACRAIRDPGQPRPALLRHGPVRPLPTRPRKQTQYCGMFKTPTLRNVATRQVFFHNGYFHTLDAVMHFYVERDTDPRKWYPVVRGKVVAFDDLPPRYRGNVDHGEAPMDRATGRQARAECARDHRHHRLPGDTQRRLFGQGRRSAHPQRPVGHRAACIRTSRGLCSLKIPVSPRGLVSAHAGGTKA